MAAFARRAMILLSCATLGAPAQAADIDWNKVATTFGRPLPTVAAGGVYRFGLARSDLKVVVDGVTIKPAFALGGWIAFAPAGDAAMAMGDLVLTQEEINPVMKRLIADGFEITAIHNHLLRADPTPMYMHVEGHGDPVKLAATLHDALALSKVPPPAAAPASQAALEIDMGGVDAAMRAKGTPNGGVYQFNVPRAEPVKDAGMEIPPAMGSAHAINFQPTGGGKAAITGDFVLLGDEVNPVLRALRANNIEVTALHSHMLNDDPRLFFMHFWANADAVTLAKGVREALDKTKAKRG
jgi:hypothetical protein